ncbi:hypothetical protein CHLNCDRAFT_137839 [Chlorella variabilis]|uniref:CNNM transmembrane domain-containing protein n=1 Tax=Chlorella variabilis TaxID=554065 RepID=E1Z4M0_CHLVA|nr:hypothetical protein CHLNCDRAFT_137839 [Chlorella variabilis]EFN59369.1 hypothetical protein CHLNCDRAFT_137839 [Chlorella variabilis]|eukprot:XP_005851471.1 hypothetical protein CHLNCDRAFT_137839 [Chlorella variabilis]
MVPLTHRLLLIGSVQAQSWLRHRGQAGSPAPLAEDDDEEMFVTYLLLSFFLVAMAGLMSGLTLGLMSLDQVDIEILHRSGTERQKRLAQRIRPMLKRPHVLLVTLLVCNAIAAEALPLVLDRLADPVTAVIVSVTVVLLFGEIIPQAACSRYGLQIGAYSAPFVRLLMMLTAPISYPIGWVLDQVLGHRHTALFRRAELKALMDIHREGQEFGGHLSAGKHTRQHGRTAARLAGCQVPATPRHPPAVCHRRSAYEVSIIKGALDMTHKTARDAMTPIDMVFMLPADDVLDEATLTAIMASGHSRIPVHRPGDRRAILGIMLVKELLLVDRSQGKTVGRQKVRSIPSVRADTPLYDMLKLFEIGRSHMAVLMQLKKKAAERRKQESEAELMHNIDSMSDDPSLESADEEQGLLSPRPTAQPEDFIFDSAGSGAVSPVPSGGARGATRTLRLPPSGRGGGQPPSAGASANNSTHGGLLYKQGSVGAALVAEALRQEVALQLAAAAAAAAGGGVSRPSRSRSRSPLPTRGASRHSLSSPERAVLWPPGSATVAPAGHVQPGSGGGGGGGGSASGQQPLDVPPPLFPGLRRTRSELANSSGASTPRLVVPLPPPPARRSTNLSQRVQEQMDLLEPLLITSRRASGASSGVLSLEGEASGGATAGSEG